MLPTFHMIPRGGRHVLLDVSQVEAGRTKVYEACLSENPSVKQNGRTAGEALERLKHYLACLDQENGFRHA